MKKIKLEILKVDRRKATGFSCPFSCLLATAAKRHFNSPSVAVGMTTVAVCLVGDFTFSNWHNTRLERAFEQPIRAFRPFTVMLAPYEN